MEGDFKMKHSVLGKYVICDIDLEKYVSEKAVNCITHYTKNTWQKERNEKEKLQDTKQGKIAEEVVRNYLNECFDMYMKILSYDEIRTDNGKKHAPFDFLFYSSDSSNINEAIESIQRDINNTGNFNVRLSEKTRKLCRDGNIKIVEIKSTKINKNKKYCAKFNNQYDDKDKLKCLINEIEKDDIFCYPAYVRATDNKNYSMDTYCQHVKKIIKELDAFEGEDLRNKVIQNERQMHIEDIYIRVYLDIEEKKGIILGWISKDELLDHNVTLKKMPKIGKSEKALYLAKSLRSINGIGEICECFNKMVYANPMSTRAFYHCDKKCKYLSYADVSSLIEYKNEREAISEGRFVTRCKECFREREINE